MGNDNTPRNTSELPTPRTLRVRRRATRGDVAQLAQVSTAVVSYVVNNGPRPVAPVTAERVRRAMNILGYQPNSTARDLSRGTTQTVGLVVADSLNPFFAEYALELAQAAAGQGWQLLTVDSRGDADTEDALIRDLVARQVDGLLIATTAVRQEATRAAWTTGVPTVFIDRDRPIPGYSTVGASALQGANDLVLHLIGHGRRTIGLVIGDGLGPPDPRELGWRQVLRKAGLPRGPIARVPFTWEGGYQGGLQLFGSDPLPDAVFASSDRQAIGLLRALGERGLRVPEDVAVVSFDGTTPSGYTWPPLTVARQPLAAMAHAAWDLLTAHDGGPRHEEFPLELVIRSSCGCPSPAGRSPDNSHTPSD